ncbi:MAG: ribosomal protein S18-alanine N-acetyltransferase [Pseudomonadota bacterium]
MTPRDLADLHARCFVTPRPWSEAEFTAILSGAGALLYTLEHGFLLGRIAGPEAELLTISVDPERRRAGYGSRLLAEFEEDARNRGAIEVFLEVAANNSAARQLYASAGYVKTGVRQKYYRQPDGAKTDALILSKALVEG